MYLSLDTLYLLACEPDTDTSQELDTASEDVGTNVDTSAPVYGVFTRDDGSEVSVVDGISYVTDEGEIVVLLTSWYGIGCPSLIDDADGVSVGDHYLVIDASYGNVFLYEVKAGGTENVDYEEASTTLDEAGIEEGADVVGDTLFGYLLDQGSAHFAVSSCGADDPGY